MKRRLKYMSLVLAIFMIITATTACGSKNAAQTSNDTEKNQSVTSETANTASTDAVPSAPKDEQKINDAIDEKSADNGQTAMSAALSVTYDIDQNNKDTFKRASLIVPCDANEFLSNFAQGDLVSAEFDTGEVLQIPVCGSYDDVSPGEIVLKAAPNATKFTIATNYGEFALELGFMERTPENSEFAYQMIESKFPHTVTIRLLEKGAYLDRIALGKLTLSKSRDDYPDLSDEEYANFRNIVCGSIAPEVLYRSSSPIDNDIGRCKQADDALKANKIRTVVNMADSEEDAKKMSGYNETYYSNCNTLYKKMSMSFGTDVFNGDIADALKFIADNEGPYLIHCVYGKDRTGLLCAIIESLCGASMKEIQSEYLKTYELLYDVKDGHHEELSSENKHLISETIANNMSYAYGTEVTADNHYQKTVEYLLSIGLTANDIEAIQNRLCGSDSMGKAA